MLFVCVWLKKCLFWCIRDTTAASSDDVSLCVMQVLVLVYVYDTYTAAVVCMRRKNE